MLLELNIWTDYNLKRPIFGREELVVRNQVYLSASNLERGSFASKLYLGALQGARCFYREGKWAQRDKEQEGYTLVSGVFFI